MIPFEFDFGQPIVEAFTPGGPTHWYILDTGWPQTNLSPEVTRAKVLPGERWISDGDERRYYVPVAHDRAINLGDEAFEHFDATVFDYPPDWTKAFKRHIVGQLNWRLFSGVLLTIDYSRYRITMENGTLPPPNNADILPLRIGTGGLLEIPVSLAGQQVWMLLDTGASANGCNVSIKPAVAAGLRWLYPPVPSTAQFIWGRNAAAIGQLDGDLHVGQYAITQPAVLEVAGCPNVLAGPTLRHFRVTLDVRHRRVRLVPSADAAVGCRRFSGETDWDEAEEAVRAPRRARRILIDAGALRKGVTVRNEGRTRVVLRPNGHRLLFTTTCVLVDVAANFQYTLRPDGGVDVDAPDFGYGVTRWYERSLGANATPELVLLNPLGSTVYRHVDRGAGTTTTTSLLLTVEERADGSSRATLLDGLTLDWSPDDDVTVGWPDASSTRPTTAPALTGR